MEWKLSNSAIFKILATALLVYLAIELVPLLTLTALAVLLAVSLYPIPRFLVEKGMPRWLALGLVTVGVMGTVASFFVVLLPPLIDQVSMLIKSFPVIEKSIVRVVPDGGARKMIQRFIAHPDINPEHVMTAGQTVLTFTSQIAVLLVLAVYLVADGKRTFEWLIAFFSKENRVKLERTADEGSKIIFAYVMGQVITSALCSVVCFAILTSLKVPGALVLSVLAGVFDVLPVLGFFVSTIPATLIAWTVSSTTALAVVALYLAYHFVENYFVVPKVYGNRLRLSDLVVLFAVLAGGLLGGIPGMILILPIIAIYPIVEKIWLVEYLGRATVKNHDTIPSQSKPKM